MAEMTIKRLQEGAETWHSDPQYRSNLSIQYLVFHAPNKEAAIRGVLQMAPSTMGKLFLREVQFDGYEGDALILTATYTKEAESSDPDDVRDNDLGFTFSTTGGTMRRSAPLLRKERVPSSAPNHDGINVNDQMEVDGVDVVCPVFSFTETHYFKGRKVNNTYKNRLALLTGRMNRSAFRGYKPGEVLFMGAEGGRKGIDRDDLWEITFKFSVQRSEENIRIGGLTLEKKAGWDYLWVKWGRKVVNGRLTNYAKALYVDRVYYTADFSQLGIGTR